MEDIIDIIVTETTNLIEITSQPTDEIIDVNIIDNREDVTLNVTPTVVEININSLTGNFGVNWGEIDGTLSNQTDLQNALNLKADLVGGKVPSSQLPSYVDDVVEVANYAALPTTGETGKIYVTIDTNFIYRWTGSVYVEIKDSSAVWGAITGTLSNQTDLQNALNAKLNLTGGTLSGALTLGASSGDNQTLLNLPAGNQLIYRENAGSLYGFNIESGVDNSLFLTNTEGGYYQTLYFGDSQGGYNIFGISTSSNSGSTWNPRLVVNQNGNVGLNKNNPTEILDVAGNGLFSGNVTANSFIKSGGTSSQFLKADGSVDSSTYLTTSAAASTYVSGSGTTNYLPRWSSSKVLTDSFVYTNGNYTEIQGQGLTASMGIVVSGRYGSVANAPKIYSSDETTGVAHIEFVNGGGEIRLGVEKSTGGQILPGSSAYATVLTAGLSGRNLEFGTNNTKRMTISGSTGAVTLTSTITATGATLTGALSGTSATFSSTITSSRNDAGNISLTLQNSYINQGNLINFIHNSAGTTTNGYIGHGGDSTGNFVIINNGITALSMARATGAATFSSSVTAGGKILTTASGNDTFGFQMYKSGTTTTLAGFYQNTTGDGLIAAYNSAGTQNVQIATNGVSYFNGGNVGIGTTSPNDYGAGYKMLAINGSTAGILQLRSNDSGIINIVGTSASADFEAFASKDITFKTGVSTVSERMRITSGGDLLVGLTAIPATIGDTTGFVAKSTGTIHAVVSGDVSAVFSRKASDGSTILFRRDTTTVGSISVTTAMTSYNVTSDYRLKEDLKPINGLDIVNKIKVYDYKWKADNSRMDGVLAHELQEVLPYAVTGVKDGEQMQQVDYSKIVPVMVQAIKDLKAELDTLKNK